MAQEGEARDIDQEISVLVGELLMEKYGYSRDEWPLEWDRTDPYAQITAWTENTFDVITAMRKLEPDVLETWLASMHRS
jgi:hypothetical protein